jgi:hypothetical protein
MARVTVDPVRLDRTPVSLLGGVAGDPSGGGRFVNDGYTVLLVRNTGAGPHLVTIESPIVVDGLAVADLQVVVAAGDLVAIGPLSAYTFTQRSGPDAGYAYASGDGAQAELRYTALRTS